MMGSGGPYRAAVLSALLAVTFVLAAGATPGLAHWADLAVAEISVAETSARMILTFPTGLAGPADANGDGHLSSSEVVAHRDGLEALLSRRIRMNSGDEAGRLTVASADAPAAGPNMNVTPKTHSTVLLVYTWTHPIRTLAVSYDLFVPGVSTASCLATILADGRVHNVVFTPEHREFTLAPGHTALVAEARSFVILGIEHIVTGYDHILFLISLLVLGGGLRSLLKIVSAFTVAHSITLSLAVLNVVALPARWVESAIALSIVYVALENFWKGERALRNRWLITFGFGLVHGLGFASILKEMAIPRAGVVLALAGFNLGVEAGQVAVVAVAFAALLALRAWPREMVLRRLISAGAAGAGLIWFIQRAILPT